MPGPRAEPVSAPLPPLVLAMLWRRRAEIARAARGVVLELGPYTDDEGYEEAAVDEVVRLRSLDEIAPGRRFDTIISCCALPSYPDLPAAARRIAESLEESGRFQFVEPVSMPGLRGALAGFGSSLVGSAARLHLDRDVPSALRHNGLIVTAIERFKMPTMFGSLRHWVAGVALPEGPTDRPGALDETVGGES